MKRYISGSVLIVVLGGVVWADAKTDAEVAELDGVWELEALEIMGKKIDAPKGKGGSIAFGKDRKWIMKDPNKPDKKGRFTLDAGANPKKLDLIESKDGKEATLMQVIYEIEDDRLKMAFSADGRKGERPSAFKGERVGVMSFKRQK